MSYYDVVPVFSLTLDQPPPRERALSQDTHGEKVGERSWWESVERGGGDGDSASRTVLVLVPTC